MRTPEASNGADCEKLVAAGKRLLSLGRMAEAKDALTRAVDLDPENLAACKELAVACLSTGDIQGIEQTAQRLARLAPRDRVTLNMLGLARMNRFDYDGAAEAFSGAVEVEPEAIGALVNIEVLSMRSLRHRRFLEKSPRIAHWRTEAIGRLMESHHRGALDDGELKDLLMLLAGSQETFEQAVELARELSSRTLFSLVLANQIAMIFQLAGDLASLRRFDAITYALDPSSRGIRLGRAQTELFAGYECWKECWETFRDVVGHYSSAASDRELPTWTGQPLRKGKVFVYQEQGVGDAIIGLRAIPLLAERGTRFDLWVNRPLFSLARSIGGFEQLIDSADRPDPRSLDCDYAIPLFGLIATLDLGHETLARHPTVLVPAPERAAPTRKRLRALPGRRIGLVYGGNPERRDDWFRAIPAGALAPLSRLQGISWVNLTFDQRPDRAEVVSMLNADDPMQQLVDFEDTAAIISELDAVIAIDSSVAHLAASLGKLRWVLVPPMLDWRWQIGSDTAPWWPNVTLLRARQAGQWDEVIEELARQVGAADRPDLRKGA